MVRLTVTSASADAARVTVHRQDPDGALRPVRSMMGVPAQRARSWDDAAADVNGSYASSAGLWDSYAAMRGAVAVVFGEDYEAPLDRAVKYVARFTRADGTESAPVESGPVTVPWQQSVIRDVAHPPTWQPAVIVTIPAMDRDLPHAVHQVIGRPDPVTVAGVRQHATFTMTLLTLDEEAAGSLRALLASAPYLMLNAHPAEGGRIWFLAGAASEQRTTPGWCWETSRYWEITCTETGPPPFALVTESASWTYQHLIIKLGDGADYARLALTWPDYLAIADNRDPLAAEEEPARVAVH